ncbi:MAG TPA: hypothetical protein VNI02_08650 [Blastocatellia bacterium]|jgi:hypothetical protein|nr:hypothetical protein [Blastocatellia bacterium]
MKRIQQLSVVVVGLVLFAIPLSAQAQSRPKKLTIGKLIDEFEIAFVQDRLERLDAKRPHHGRIRVEIEYSTIEPDIKVFRTFGALGRWLRNMETDSAPMEDGSTMKLPMRVMSEVSCKRGVCTYDYDGGILHNHLYIKKSHTAI